MLFKNEFTMKIINSSTLFVKASLIFSIIAFDPNKGELLTYTQNLPKHIISEFYITNNQYTVEQHINRDKKHNNKRK